jgi:hypothetical protein
MLATGVALPNTRVPVPPRPEFATVSQRRLAALAGCRVPAVSRVTVSPTAEIVPGTPHSSVTVLIAPPVTLAAAVGGLLPR